MITPSTIRSRFAQAIAPLVVATLAVLSPVAHADGDGGQKRTGPREGEGGVRKGPRDGEGGVRKGPRDGEGGVRKGPGDGEGGVRRGPADGEGGVRRAPGGGEQGNAITINLDNRGRMVMGEGQLLATDRMREELRNLAARANGRRIVLRADQGISTIALQSMINECQRAGIKNLYLSGGR